jgi:hypothetical protein
MAADPSNDAEPGVLFVVARIHHVERVDLLIDPSYRLLAGEPPGLPAGHSPDVADLLVCARRIRFADAGHVAGGDGVLLVIESRETPRPRRDAATTFSAPPTRACSGPTTHWQTRPSELPVVGPKRGQRDGAWRPTRFTRNLGQQLKLPRTALLETRRKPFPGHKHGNGCKMVVYRERPTPGAGRPAGVRTAGAGRSGANVDVVADDGRLCPADRLPAMPRDVTAAPYVQGLPGRRRECLLLPGLSDVPRRRGSPGGSRRTSFEKGPQRVL